MTDLSDIRSAIGAVVRDVVHDAAQGLLGDLLSTGANQHTRLLRLHTPLGPDVLLAERARINEGIGPRADAVSSFGIELHALSTNPALAPETLIGQPVLLELLTAHSRTELRPFHGHVLAFELMGSDGGLARYRLRIGAWLDFLRHRTDAWLFQDQSVVGITEAIFADYAAQGALRPAWRWDLKDPAAYPRLSTFSQHGETDFGFLMRLWAANGLFHWFEHANDGNHAGDAGGATVQGSHTLVIADHNGAFQPNRQGRIRYTQAGATLKEDSITRWHGRRAVGASMLNTASHDYRSVASHAGSAQADAGHGQPMALVHTDQPGAYAFETPEEAQRLALIKLQSLQALRKQFHGRGTVRTLSPGSTFVLADHAEHTADLLQGGEDAARFVVLGAVHTARNNLSADAKAGLQHRLGGAVMAMLRHGDADADAADDVSLTASGNASQEPLYEARFTAQRASVPFRAPMQDEQGRLLHAKPTAWGTQTALVVGLEDPIHTDRDGRVKVQFHWQRGAGGSHRQGHPAGDNAPASDAAGTWVRVSQDWAGANWGAVFIPRLGQEVVVAFVEGDIDRPLIIGAAYNGEGSENAQGNRIAGGAAKATGNAPAWFPGSERQGDKEGHAHNASLSGFKSQSLEASQGGGGGHNQLVFDDTPGQGRVLAHTTQSQSWLQMGHLLQQQDNQRLAQRGHGLELHTRAQGAIRAGSGLHLSTHASGKGSHSPQGQPMQTREAQGQLQAHGEVTQALSGNAQTHLAGLPREPAVSKLPVQQAIDAMRRSLQAVRATSGGAGADAGLASNGDASSQRDGDKVMAIDGGQGSIPVSDDPQMILSAAADIASLTPANTVLSMGANLGIVSGQDTNLLSQRHMAWAVKDGISLFTRGEAKDDQRAVQDTGMKLHAASGNVNVQAQGDAFKLTAQKAIDVQSTSADIVISAPERIVLNGGGGYIKLEGGDIEIGTQGPARFMAGMKVLTGGEGASASGPNFANAQAIDTGHHLQYQAIDIAGKPLADRPYVLIMADGSVHSGKTDAQGKTKRITVDRPQQVQVFIEDADHQGFRVVSGP